MVTVTLLYVDGCPNWRLADQRLRELQAEAGFTLEHVRVDTPEEAQRLGFHGSPTVLVDGTDPFATEDAPPGLACRVYATSTGLRGTPTLDQLRSVLGEP